MLTYGQPSFKPLQVFYKLLQAKVLLQDTDEFQTLIGILQTDESFDELGIFAEFQTLIGILQTRTTMQVFSISCYSFKPLQVFYKQIRGHTTFLTDELFQTLIGILQTQPDKPDHIFNIEVSNPYRYSTNTAPEIRIYRGVKVSNPYRYSTN